MATHTPPDSWQLIKRIIDLESSSGPFILKLRSYLWNKFYDSPQTLLKFVDQVLCFGDRRLDLTKKPMVMQLFQEYLYSDRMYLSKSELIHRIYIQRSDLHLTSSRLQESYQRNIVKLISRARNLARHAFGNESEGVVEWFAYDPLSRSYHLYRLRDRDWEQDVVAGRMAKIG